MYYRNTYKMQLCATTIVLKTKPVQWFDQINALSGFLRVTGPTNKKPEKLYKNNAFLRGYDPKTQNLAPKTPYKA
jgi:hypothetical protein